MDVADDREAQRELAAALKHDLGKYVAWRSANLGDAAWRAPIEASTLEALQADVLRTRTASSGDESAWALFERLTREWRRPWPSELDAVERAVGLLRSHERALGDGDANALGSALAELRAAQQTIRTELAALVRRLAREE